MIPRKVYGPLAAAALIVAAVVLVASHRPKPVPPPVNAVLNETLTNSMSDSSCFAAIDREVGTFMKYGPTMAYRNGGY